MKLTLKDLLEYATNNGLGEETEIKESEYIRQMTMSALLILFEKQNTIF